MTTENKREEHNNKDTTANMTRKQKLIAFRPEGDGRVQIIPKLIVVSGDLAYVG